MDRNQLYSLFSSVRKQGNIPFSFHGLVEIMRSAKPEASMKEILEAAQMMRFLGVSITPDSILSFLTTIIEKRKYNSLYVPFATGMEVESLKSIVPTIVFNNLNSELREVIQEKTGVPCSPDVEINDLVFDVVYSDLPFESFRNDCIQKTIIEESIGKLKQNGYGIFTFANNIVYSSIAKRWIASLSEKGIYITAIIDFPEGIYEPTTTVGSKIIIFSKQKTDKVFLAKLKKETDAPIIAGYFLSKTESPKAEHLGKWFQRDLFSDFISYENELRRKRTAAKLKKDYNANLLPISEISFSVLAPKKTEPQFSEAENAVYIPKLGKSNVVTNLNSLQIKPQNYFQILVDQEKVLPEFLQFFFNTDNGITVRFRASTGNPIPVLSVQRIKDIEVPVPPLKIQANILNVYSELSQIELEASRLKDRLQSIPASYSNVAKNIRDIDNKGDKFEQWIESLPYPLATILKRYIVSDTNQQKQEMLFYFFEAYSIFIAAILTAIYQQPQFNYSEIKDVGIDYFEKASFGSWVKMDRAMAKNIRVKMDDPTTTIDSMLDCFHTEDQSLVKLISLGENYSILQRACDYRNSWKGHSGITSEAIYADHVRVLDGELLKLQDCIKDLYDKIRLIRPLSLKRRQGEFTNRVEVLTGSNAIFMKDEIIGEPLDDDKLYIQVLDTKETFEVPPFFVLKNSPSDVKNACYFYSRLEGSNSRYVSYHFEGKPEEIEEGETAFDIIKTILERTTNS